MKPRTPTRPQTKSVSSSSRKSRRQLDESISSDNEEFYNVPINKTRSPRRQTPHNKVAKKRKPRSKNKVYTSRGISGVTKCSMSDKQVKEMHWLQTTTELIFPKLSFSRVIREIAQNYDNNNNLRFTRMAIQALHEATEYHLTGRFQSWDLLGAHAKRATLKVEDIKLGEHLLG